jgi:NodT family efflux transporter outer membrane factor (OMF) lipoprotein
MWVVLAASIMRILPGWNRQGTKTPWNGQTTNHDGSQLMSEACSTVHWTDSFQSHPMRVVLLVGAALFASGCGLPKWAKNDFKVGPNYCHPPAVAVADNWIDSDDPRVLSQPPEYADWWSVFEDPVLNGLVETSYQQNLTLREAGMRILQARAQRAMVAGNLYPQTQQIAGSYARDQISIVQQPYLEPIPGLFSRSFDAWSLSGNLSWELDVWGRFRRAIESADASLDASVYEYDAILVCLIAEVVTAYVDIRTFEQRLVYARRNVQIQQRSLELTSTQAKEGKTGDIGVHLSTSNLDGTKATIPTLEIGLRQANNRLCTLLGLPTIDLSESLEQGDGIPTAPVDVAVGIPADLLRRRPDVRAAERQVAAQSAQIGVAISDLYPSIAVTGEISVNVEEFRDLFSSLSQGGSIGPGFRWNVLNYGRIANNVRVQEAGFQELVATYQQAVLTANQEVEDALVAFLRNQERVQSLAGSTQATQSALELELLNFKEGETDFTGVFVLQGDLVRKQDQLAEAQGTVVTSLVDVYKALGGGWQIRCPGYQPQQFALQTPTNMETVPAPDAAPRLPVPSNVP